MVGWGGLGVEGGGRQTQTTVTLTLPHHPSESCKKLSNSKLKIIGKDRGLALFLDLGKNFTSHWAAIELEIKGP